ncbi:hypothetical protein M9Y10_034360 [Tritrichomonas musculus]|uniref:Non-specific serine/threonine protein kinase n=1 Tax=Tritrichomonas musculus TaxID=1915356 RepID=A0ABR2KEW0_9EUKA
MNDALSLFDSLLKNLFESFSSDAKECFSQFEVLMNPLLDSEAKLDEIFESIFNEFPESNFKYQKIIEALFSFASIDPVSILSNFCDRFIKELKRTDDQEPEILTINLESACISNFYFFHFTHHLNLKILTDLIKIFFIHFTNSQLIQKVVSCGFNLCTSSITDFPNNNDISYNSSCTTIFSPNILNTKSISKNNIYLRTKNPSSNRFSKLKFQLIKTWSIIFHHISKISMDEISFTLEQYSDYASSGHIFTLISKVYANSSFIELLLYTVKNCQKHKQITAEMLSSLSSLFLIVKDVSEQVLVDFLTVAWSLKNHSKLKEEAIQLICVLFNRLPEYRTKSIQFYISKIYKQANNDRKVKRAAKGFLTQIRGDVSKLTSEGENPQFFNSSGTPPNDCFAVIFVKTFFERSNFNVCIDLFGQILAHLASIDILTFERIIVPNFIKIDFLSPRFVSMAVALKIMSTETFLNDNFCKSSKSRIDEINSCFKQKIVDSLSQLLPYCDDKYMILTRKVYKNLQKIENSDQIVIEFINNNSLKDFNPSTKSPKLSYVNDSADRRISLQEELDGRAANNGSEEESKTNDTEDKSKNNKASTKFKLLNFIKTKENSNSIENDEKLNDKSIENNSIALNKDELNLSSIADLIRVTSCIADLEVIKSTDLVVIIVRFMCHFNKEISIAAGEVFENLLKIEGAFEIIINQIVTHLMTFDNEVASHCLYFLYKVIKNNKMIEKFNLNLKDGFYKMIEIYSFCCLVFDSPFCRLIALDILKRLSLNNNCCIYNILRESHSILTDSFNESIFLLKTPDNPCLIRPIIGTVSIENACCCRYNKIWLYFFSNVLNRLMSMKKDMSSFIVQCSHIIHDVFSHHISLFTLTAASLIYIDSFVYETNLPIKTPNISIEKESQLKVVIDFDSDFDIKESQKLKMANFSSILDLLNSNNLAKKKSLIYVCSLLNWRIIARILPELLTIENDLYPSLSESFVYLIRHSENFNGVISALFPFLIKFLKLLQNYFTFLDINSTREIVWDDKHIDLLKPHQELCVNYCILSSMPFKSDQLQIQEHNMPLIYRQVQMKFLIHWSQLPTEKVPDFNKLKTYSIQTLVLIINSGPVFIEGFVFDRNFFNLMMHCELNGDPVLYSLLYYHVDLLMSEFVKNSLIRTKEENRFFLTQILSILSEFNDPSLFENHIGSLILLSIILKKEKNAVYRQIITKLDSLFVKKLVFQNENDKKKLKFLNIFKNFEFASEQIVESALNILQECDKNILLFKEIIDVIHPLFKNVHFVPKKRIIFQGVPTKFQRFTTVSFINSMFNVSSSLDEEKIEYFSILWYKLLLSTDNTSIVLLLLFDHSNSEMKKRIFLNLLPKDPFLISKFLAKRMTFAYWYFMQTQLRQKDIKTITWIAPVLAHAFNYFFEYVSHHFIVCLHFSLLFIEECDELFEALLDAFRFEFVDSQFVWTHEGPKKIMQAAYIVSSIASYLAEKNPNEIINWTEEAIRWSVACNDVKVGYRSLYILKILQTELPQNIFPMIAKAVSYHMSCIEDKYVENPIERDLSLYIGECFDIFNRRMNDSDLVTFAFRFATLFVNCQFLDNSCLKKAIPIIMACTNHIVLMTTAKKILVDAFIPFLPNLELDIEAQKLLSQIADRKASPELFILAAAFYRNEIPFIKLNFIDEFKPKNEPKKEPKKEDKIEKDGKKIPMLVINQNECSSDDDSSSEDDEEFSFNNINIKIASSPSSFAHAADQILSTPMRTSRIQKALKIFGKLLYTASFELTDSILDVCSILLQKYEDEIDINILIPIFLFAIKNISSMTGAKNFIRVIGKVNPSIIRIIAEKYSLPFTIIKTNIDNEENYYNDDYYEYEYDNNEDVYFNDSLEIKRKKADRNHNNIEYGNLVIYNLNINMNSNRFLTLDEGSIENRKKIIEEIKKGLDELDENPIEIVPFTNCKQLSNLNGLINQINPPAISPFAAQYDLVSRVMKDNQEIKRTSSYNGVLLQLKSVHFASNSSNTIDISSSSNSSILVSPSSPALPDIRIKQSNFISTPYSESNLKLEEIPIRPIILRNINYTHKNSFDITQYVVKPNEFLGLKE